MEMKTKVIHKNLILLGSILLLFAAAAAYVVFLNFSRLTPSGNDIWGHLYKVQVLYDNLREGNFYPLFGQTWYNGSQLYRYWAPVTYYLMALLTGICRGNLMQAYRLLAGVSIFLGGIPWIILGRKQRRYGLGLHGNLLEWSCCPWLLRPDCVAAGLVGASANPVPFGEKHRKMRPAAPNQRERCSTCSTSTCPP